MRKGSSGASYKDLWHAVGEGSLPDIDYALALLKKNGSNINSRNSLGLTPLHIVTWRNNIPIIRRLLASGADPDAKDRESGWSSLHRALHFDHLAVASVLLRSGASITLEDSKCRTPVDLLSGPVLQVFGSAQHSEFINLISSESNKVCNREDKRTIALEHPSVPFSQKFPNMDLGAIRLLERLLAFNPKDRPTTKELDHDLQASNIPNGVVLRWQALADPYFYGLANVDREPST
ncbi:ankyrin repeat and SOCS box protein 3-like [Hibiscus syriacus]|uniref:ankyrin repeat and SOCS box protein 3-like n=1 Tax=Hibiscus syriacus TaxID=106335 RepID=UPI001922302F|nr:ankyrin repeat and SOCS box protein 3-like [Hibiscus syriacus]